ncbi:hypothetical protein niasHT_019656 [Heterodera trifolii]|uniref:Uncharacterized protein n=1 Tax=Heterodera trifolii TaxID=157864 RepID=A0ABD2L7B3_9BILA
MDFGNKKDYDNEVDALLRRGQTLIQQMQEKLRKDDLETKEWSGSFELLKSLVKNEGELAKLDEENANLTEETAKKYCGAKKSGEKLDNSKKAKEFFTKITQKMEEMKTEESTVKVSIEGVYGTRAEILAKAKLFPKCVKLRTYLKVIRTIRMISKKMEVGPVKEAIEKVTNRNTVAERGDTVTIMPSELVALTGQLWAHFLEKMDKNKILGDFQNGLRHQPALIAQTFAIVWVALRAIEMRSCPLADVLTVVNSSIDMLENNHQNIMMMNKGSKSIVGGELDNNSSRMPTEHSMTKSDSPPTSDSTPKSESTPKSDSTPKS